MGQERPASQEQEWSRIGEMDVLVAGTTVTLVRTFEADPQMVFRAWTDPEQIAKWWGPSGFQIPECRFEARPGFEYEISMLSPNGKTVVLVGRVLDVDEPERLVLTQSPKGSPFTVVMTVTFEEIAGNTKMTLRTDFDSVADRDGSVEMGANRGWEESFDKLAAHLEVG